LDADLSAPGGGDLHGVCNRDSIALGPGRGSSLTDKLNVAAIGGNGRSRAHYEAFNIVKTTARAAYVSTGAL
jgi:hypothetical protein